MRCAPHPSNRSAYTPGRAHRTEYLWGDEICGFGGLRHDHLTHSATNNNVGRDERSTAAAIMMLAQRVVRIVRVTFPLETPGPLAVPLCLRPESHWASVSARSSLHILFVLLRNDAREGREGPSQPHGSNLTAVSENSMFAVASSVCTAVSPSSPPPLKYRRINQSHKAVESASPPKPEENKHQLEFVDEVWKFPGNRRSHRITTPPTKYDRTCPNFPPFGEIEEKNQSHCMKRKDGEGGGRPLCPQKLQTQQFDSEDSRCNVRITSSQKERGGGGRARLIRQWDLGPQFDIAIVV